ncbi:YhdP family protein [Marinobacteraceae bacterium S3BR75-40.1]
MPPSDTTQGRTWYQLLRWLINGIWILVLTALILVALYVGLGRQLMSLADNYRAEVEALASDSLGQPVTLAALEGDWQGLDPVLVLRDLRIGDSASPQGSTFLRTLRMRLDTVASLRRQRLVFREFTARNARLTLVQQASGTVGIKGLWVPAAGDDTDAVAWNDAELSSTLESWVQRLGRWLSDPMLRMVDLRLELQSPDGNSQRFQVPQLYLAFHQGEFLASGRLMRADANQQIAEISLRGQHLFSGGFDGQVYAEVTSPRLLDAVTAPYEWDRVGITGMDLEARTWLNFRGSRLESVLADVSIPHLALKSADIPLPPLASIRGKVGWRDEPGRGWQLNATDLTYEWEGEQVQPSAFAVSQGTEGLLIQGDRLEIGPLATFMEALGVLPGEALRSLREYRPRGQLSPLQIELGAEGAFKLSGNLEDISVQAFDGAPGVHGLDGYINMVGDEGYVRVDTHDTDLGFPKVFVAPWHFRHLTGEVGWRRVGEGWQVRSDDLRADLGDDTRLSGAFDFYTGDAVENWLALRVGVVNANAGLLPGFLPKYEMDKDLYDWLVQAVPQADIDYGWYFGYGGVDDFYPETPFSSSLFYQFSHARLNYQEQWPAVTDAEGSVRLFNHDAVIELEKGLTGGLRIDGTRVRVSEDQGDTRVDVETASTFEGDTLNVWLTQTPLAEQTGDWVKDLTFEGQLDGRLNLAIFPAAERPTQVDVDLGTQSGRLEYTPEALVWEDIAGKIHYSTQTGVSSSKLQARFLGDPVKLAISGGTQARPLAISQQGMLSVATLGERMAMERPSFLTGQLPYEARLGFSPEVTLQIQSAAKGLAITLPPPLGKPAAAESPMLLTMDWPQDGQVRIRGHWADRLAFWGEWEQRQLRAASLRLGSDKPVAPQGSGVNISGKLSRLDVTQWQNVLATEQETAEGSAGQAPDWFGGAAIDVGELVLLDEPLGPVSLKVDSTNVGWLFALDGKRIAGKVIKPASAPLQVGLDRLHLEGGKKQSRGSVEPANAADWSPVDAHVGDLRVGETVYGAIDFNLRPGPEKLVVQDMRASSRSLTFTGNMTWDLVSNYTDFQGQIRGGTISDLESWLDLGVPLTSEKTEATMDLQWPGGPHAFALTQAQGGLSLQLNSGRILNQNNVAQIFRVFGILNTDTLLRRLRLDFSDLYESGVSFDLLEAKARLAQGQLILDPDLVIKGPSGDFRLSGSTDLEQETFDMRMVVSLPLTQNLPLAALLFGAAPPVGGALFLVDRFMGDSLSRLTSATYTVRGTWDDPEIDLRNVFDTQSDLKGSPSRPNPQEESP